MKKSSAFILLLVLSVVSQPILADNGRWYRAEQPVLGEGLFQKNCAVCHGSQAESITNWSESNPTANRPPPLNGSGHAWHHSLKQLKKTIQQGTQQIGGSMPAFDDQLGDEEIDQVIAFFQSKWPDTTYHDWSKKFEVQDQVARLEDMARLLKLRLGIEAIETPIKTPVEGVYQTRFGDKFAYLIEDGRFVFIGDLIDLQRAQNLTGISRQEFIRDELAQVSASDLVIYPAHNVERAVLNVFTDTSCGFCQKMHQEVPLLQDAGITVRYLPFPRGHNRGPGYTSLKQVWCAKDRPMAMNIAKGTATGALPAPSCSAAQFVDSGFELGRRLGVSGTPALYTQSGMKFDGYVPHKELIKRMLNNL